MEFQALVNTLISDKRKEFESDSLPRIDVISGLIESELQHFDAKELPASDIAAGFESLNRLGIVGWGLC